MTLVFLFAAFLCVWLGCDFLLLLCVSSLCVSDLRAASWKNISVSHLCTLVLGSFLRVTLIKQTTTQTEQSGRFGWCKQEVQLSVSFGRVVFSLHLFTPLKILNCTHGCTHDYHCITFTIQKQTWWFSDESGVTRSIFVFCYLSPSRFIDVYAQRASHIDLHH